jgi:hypothetical protein
VGKVINPNTPGKERDRLVKSIALALRELSATHELNQKVKDLTAYIALALMSVSDTTKITISAWEKRGYWVKADKFHLEWIWTEELGKRLIAEINNEDWDNIAATNAQIAQRINHIKPPRPDRIGTPWNGAWNKFHSKFTG